MNRQFMKAKQEIVETINVQLNQGIPISVVVLTIEGILPDLRAVLAKTMQEEEAMEVATMKENQNLDLAE